MASTDWDKPTVDSLSISILDELKARDVDAIKMIDDETPTNLPEKAKRWNDALKTFQSYIATVWTNLVLAVAGGGTGASTAAGARTNLSVDSSTEVTAKIAVHQAITNPHSSTDAATPSRLVLRDAAGRAKMVAPDAASDIAIKSTVDTVQTNLTTHAALDNAHGAVSAPTVSKIILRDAAGRAQVEDPSADKDIANKEYVAAAKVTTRIIWWSIPNPATGGIPGPRLKFNATAVRIDSYCVGGDSVTFNIEERSTIGVGGSNLLVSDQIAIPGGATDTSFANSALAENNWLWLDISAVSGSPTYLIVTLSIAVA